MWKNLTGLLRMNRRNRIAGLKVPSRALLIGFSIAETACMICSRLDREHFGMD
jgi:hypothetical protein